MSSYLRYFIFLCLISTFLSAKVMEVKYRVEFGFVGEIGRIHTKYSDNTKNYLIDTHLKAIGFLAKKITHNLKEEHICKGYITKNKKRIATSYQMLKSYGKYRSMTLYTIDHKHKKVIKTYKKWLKRKGHSDRKIADYSYALDYYAKDDMVTLFLNLAYKIRDKTIPKHYQFKAVGADREQGNVDIYIPSREQTKVMSKLLGKTKKDEWLMNLVMHRQLYGSKQGELMVRMSKESTIEKAVLKDLIFFGDVRIIRE